MLQSKAMKNSVTASIGYACEVAGGLRALSRVLGISSSMIYQWKNAKRNVPVRYCQAIVALTEGHVTVQDLRPEDWYEIWPEYKDKLTYTIQNNHYDPDKGNL